MDETTKTAMDSGRPLTIFHIGEVHQLNPNATQVVNHYYGDQFVPKDQARTPQPEPENATRNFPKKTFWSTSCGCTPSTCARSGGRSTDSCGKRYWNCPPWPK